MRVGYGRTSTVAQQAGLEAQRRDLRAAGCERIFEEQVSSVDRDARVQLHAALEFIREGDTLTVTKLCRLARSVPDLLAILERINAKGASLHILSMGIDTSTPTGKLMLTVLSAVGAFEREIMLERQKEGVAKARAEGRYKGRAPTARAKADQVRDLARMGVGATEIAKQVGIGRASVYRILSAEPGLPVTVSVEVTHQTASQDAPV